MSSFHVSQARQKVSEILDDFLQSGRITSLEYDELDRLISILVNPSQLQAEGGAIPLVLSPRNRLDQEREYPA